MHVNLLLFGYSDVVCVFFFLIFLLFRTFELHKKNAKVLGLILQATKLILCLNYVEMFLNRNFDDFSYSCKSTH
ncbi:Protein of unknown function [Gryllus bimaculatus]|nr:Protein of unknown function [Gryllus bimaculatus]